MQIDNIFPLKRAFQDPRPDYILPLPGGGKSSELLHLQEKLGTFTSTKQFDYHNRLVVEWTESRPMYYIFLPSGY